MKNYIFAFCLLFTNIVSSQYYIFDSNTKEPINAVHILYNQNKGLITNDDGYFALPNNIVLDTLYLSHILFKSKKILSSQYKKYDTIFLDKSIIELDEIVLNNINPKEIVLKAINNIDKNYLTKAHNLFGFSRQSLKENSKGVEMIEVEFMNYRKNKKNYTKILKARRTENLSKWNLKTFGGAAAIIETGDFVRRKTHFLNKEKLSNYKFIYEGKIEYEGLKVHKISFIPINDSDLQNLREGSLYIDSNSYAIIEIRYTFNEVKLLKLSKEESKKEMSSKEAIYSLEKIDNVIKYHKFSNTKWCLYYIDFHNTYKGELKNEANVYALRGRLIINETKTRKVAKVKTNYNLTKDFSKAVKKFKKLKNWNDTYKFSLSNEEKQILKDINENTNK